MSNVFLNTKYKKTLDKDINILNRYFAILKNQEIISYTGTVVKVNNHIVKSRGPYVQLGEYCLIKSRESDKAIPVEVIGFEGEYVILSNFDALSEIHIGSSVLSTSKKPSIFLSNHLLGRVLDGLGRPLDGYPKVISDNIRDFSPIITNPLTKPLIRDRLETGIKSIDAFLTLGKGQRVGVFSGSGVGKSSLLGMLAKYSKADVNVIALIGERSREVYEFIQEELGEAGFAKSVLVVAIANETPSLRVSAANLASTIAEYFRDQGNDVLLIMDSITRLAMAQREIGLNSGEPATTKGYPPSVFSLLPNIVERSGTNEKGSITGVYSVLMEADDLNDPIADTLRGLLDGHIVLDRKLAHSGLYPAIDITSSISRLIQHLLSKEEYQMVQSLRELLVVYKENEELINLGAYSQGNNYKLDRAIALKESLDAFLKQDRLQYFNKESTWKQLRSIFFAN